MAINYKSDILVVPTVSSLFNLKINDNQLVQTQGYSTEGVGANLYRYDAGSSATINGGFVLSGLGGTLSFSGTIFNGTAGTGRFIAVDQTVADVTKFGADPSYVTECSQNFQRAIAASAANSRRPAVTIPVGKYKTTSTITITDHSIALVGLGNPSLGRGDDSSGTTRGATIRYSGTGTALLIGVAPGTNGTFIENTRIEHLRIEVDDNTSIAMRVWHSSHGYYNDMSIFGMKGTSNIGLQVEAGIDNIYERIEVSGIGQNVGASTADYAVGLRGKLGYSNDLATTTVFKRCYFHYCYYAAHIDYTYDFEDCVFEASAYGVISPSFFYSSFLRCWFEANTTVDAYFTPDTVATFISCDINSYARQTFFAGNGASTIKFDSCHLSTTHVSPILWMTGNAPVVDNMIFTNCTLPSGAVFGTDWYGRVPNAKNLDMDTVTYRYIESSVTGTNTFNTMTTEDGVQTSYRIPKDGHLLGVRVLSSAAMSGGSWDLGINVNGSSQTLLSYPIVPTTSSTPFTLAGHPYQAYVEAGDILTVYLHTASVSGTLDFIVEVDVALGNDGRQ